VVGVARKPMASVSDRGGSTDKNGIGKQLL
jgi:hypothetical protein